MAEVCVCRRAYFSCNFLACAECKLAVLSATQALSFLPMSDTRSFPGSRVFRTIIKEVPYAAILHFFAVRGDGRSCGIKCRIATIVFDFLLRIPKNPVL